MAILSVGPTSTYPTIADAMAAAGPGDIILLEAGYSNEIATVLQDGLAFDGGASSTGIVLQLGNGISSVTLLGTAPINVLDDGGDGNTIIGNDGDNVVTVSGGADSVSGGLGQDRLVVDYRATSGAVTGNSTTNFADAGGLGQVTINGGFEDFTILTGSGDDSITTGAGDDVINTGEGASTVDAGEGVNSIIGGSGTDTITAGGGGNFIDGGDGTNTITTGGGDDVITGGIGDDTIIAGAGNDQVTVTGGVDTFDAGAGDDLLNLDYSASITAITGGVTGGTLAGGYDGNFADLAGNSVVFQGTERFSVTTGSGDDVIATGDGDDAIGTGAGADQISGGGGDDMISAGAGGDAIDGGTGSDTVMLSGNRADYDVDDLGGGVYSIADLRAGSPDGTDTAVNVEFVAFVDGTFAIGALLNDAPVVDLDTTDGAASVDDTNLYAEDSFASGIGASIGITDDGTTLDHATVTITDPEAGDILTVTLPLPPGISVDTVNSTATMLILIGSASPGDYATALGQVGYSSSSNDPTDGGTNTNRLITVVVNDGVLDSAPATMTMSVFGVNDEPILTATALNPTFPEGSGFFPLFSSASASTIEAGQTVTSMTLTVSNVTDGADELLAVDGTAIVLTNGFSVVTSGGNALSVTVTVTAGLATLTFSGATMSAAQVQSLVEGFAYSNSSQSPTDADRVVTITQIVDSGSNLGANDNVSSPNLSSTVNVDPANDAPVNGVPGDQTINEDGSFTLSAGSGNALSVSDVDATTLTVTLTVAHGALTLASTTGLSFAGGSDGTADATMTFSGTTAAINAALGSGLTYVPTANYNGLDALDFTTDDGGQSGGPAGTDTDTVNITVNSVNDAPAGTDNVLAGSENDPLVFTAADFGFSDALDGDGFLAVIIDTFPANGTLYLDTDGPGGAAPTDISIVGPGVFVSVADIDLGRLYFQPGAGESGDAYASFTFRVQDDGGMARGGIDRDPIANTITIDVQSDNVAPVVDLNGAGTGIDYSTTYVEDGAAVTIGNPITVSDPNSGAGDLIEGATVVLTDRVAGDSLVFTTPLPGGFTATFSSTAGSITIQINGTGTGADYQAILGSIGYSSTSPDPTAGGTDLARTITVTVDDGTLDSAVATTTINITAADDAAVAQPDAFTITESGTITGGNLFASNGAGADSDPDGPPLAISAVNGSGANVGTQILLASGALLTVNAGGTFDYNPNGAFLPTPTAGSGASNTPGHDSFTYTLAGGNTVTVSIALTGLDTDDVLRGTAGADTLAGGAGNDTYFVENSGDQVVEVAGGGFDGIYTDVDYALGAGVDVEWLSASSTAGTGSISLSGNELGQYVLGNDGANTLNGGGGADMMAGYGSNDTYVVDNAGDIVRESAGGGFDAVYASVDYALGAGVDVEWLSTSFTAGTGSISLSGNELGQYLLGNDGANTLNGGRGADVMVGYGGNDTYLIDHAGDQVVEAAGGGFDAVYTDVDYSLSAGVNVEWLSTSVTSGTGSISLTGNELGQYLFGNNGANTLNGGGGADVMTGFGGADTFAFTTAPGAGNVDTVTDFVSGTDRIALDDAVFAGMGGLGTLGAGAFHAGTAAGDADDRIIYDSASGQLFYDADGNGSGAQILFATLQGGPLLIATDFIMI
jgi:Ca2+-binding RTX toxin-like protein